MISIRTRIARSIVVALIAASSFATTGCMSQSTAPAAPPPPPPPQRETPRPTQIVGTASLLPGAFGELGNCVANLYSSFDDWNRYRPFKSVRVTGSGPQVAFAFGNLVPGTYYVDVWKDTDNSARWSAGDFVGWYGNGSLGSPGLTPLQVREGETVNVGDLFMYLIVANAQVVQSHRLDR